MQMLKRPDDSRTPAKVRRALRGRARTRGGPTQRPEADRLRLYAQDYDDLFQRVPTHPEFTRKQSAESTREVVEQQMKFMRRFLEPTVT